jgi:hypothetical protein
MFDGWLPLGGIAGQVSKIAPATDEGGWGNALMVDTYKGGGRQFFFQRINDGLPAHNWELSARVKTVGMTNADNRLGIDPTGGMDPTSPNVIWGTTNTLNGAYETLTTTTMGRGANGITVFLATGYDFSRGNRAPQSGAENYSTQTWFDNVILTPEPGSMILLAIGGLLCLARRR